MLARREVDDDGKTMMVMMMMEDLKQLCEGYLGGTLACYEGMIK